MFSSLLNCCARVSLPWIGDIAPRIEVPEAEVAAVVASGGNIGAVNVPILGK